MRVFLIDIENHFDQHLIESGLELLRATTEYTLQQPDQAHYQVHSSHPAYQVDLNMLQDGYVNVKCYCTPFKKTKQCKHVVAALFLLREHLLQVRKPNKQRRQDNPVLDEALRKMKITDLRRFIAHYAASHASFKAELLANTLHLTKKPDYATLLMELTPIDKYGHIKINRNNIKTLRGIISVLLKQAQQLFKEKALPETFRILEPVISYLYRLIYKFPAYQPPLLIDLKSALRLLEVLYHQPMAPRLQQSAIRFALDLSQREGYFIVKNTPPVLRLTEPFVLEQKVKQTLVQLVEQKITSGASSLLDWAALLIRWGNRWKLNLKIKPIFQRISPLLPDIIQEFYQQKDYESLLFAVHLIPEPNRVHQFNRTNMQLGLKAAQALSVGSDIIKLSAQLSEQYLDTDAWEILLRENSNEAKKVIRRLQADHSPGHDEAADSLILHGLNALHRWDELTDRLISLKEPARMMAYDQSLIQFRKADVVQFYVNNILTVKETYGGALSRQKLNNIFDHLKSLDLYAPVMEKLKQMDIGKNNRINHQVIKGFVFDLDGVIVDTAVHHFQSWKRLMKEIGVDIVDEDDHHTRGASRMESLEYLLTKYGVKKTAKEKEELAARKNAYYLQAIEQITPDDLLPGALQFLYDSQKAGLKLALGSASKNAKGVLAKLGISDRFDAILDGNDAQASKPDPEIFTKASAALELAPENVVVFEDAAKGVQAALAAGCHCVGIGHQDTLHAADLVIANLAAMSPMEIINHLS